MIWLIDSKLGLGHWCGALLPARFASCTASRLSLEAHVSYDKVSTPCKKRWKMFLNYMKLDSFAYSRSVPLFGLTTATERECVYPVRNLSKWHPHHKYLARVILQFFRRAHLRRNMLHRSLLPPEIMSSRRGKHCHEMKASELRWVIKLKLSVNICANFQYYKSQILSI